MAARVTDNAGQFTANCGQCCSSASPPPLVAITRSRFWIDPARDVSGVILMQLLPFCDSKCLEAFAGFERGVYAELDATQKAA